MSYLGSWKIDDLLTFAIVTTRFDTGAATDADSAPAYRIYEDETSTPILTGTMATLDSANTAGFYSEQITLSAANGFEQGKSYNIYIQATVNSVIGASTRSLQILAPVDAVAISGDVVAATNWETMLDGTGGNTLSLGRLVVTNTGAGAAVAITGGSSSGAGIEVTGGATNGKGLDITGTGSGRGVEISAGASGGVAVDILSPASDGLSITGGPSSAGLSINTGANGSGAVIQGGSGSGPGLSIAPGATGIGVEISGGATSGDGVVITATSGDGLDVSGGGAGVDIRADITGNLTGNVSGSVGSVTGDIGGLDAGAVTDVQDAVWDAPIADHLDAGSTGEALSNASAGGDPSAIAAAVWDEDATGHQTQGSFGQVLGDSGADTDTIWGLVNTNLNATVGSRATQTSVDDLPTNAELTTALTNLDAAVSTRATPAQVNTEVVDALNVDTYGEPTGAPPATTTIQRKLSQTYMALRNGLTVTATEKAFKDDGGATEWTKALSDDGTTYTEGEGV